jgi:hypothetical protein
LELLAHGNQINECHGCVVLQGPFPRSYPTGAWYNSCGALGLRGSLGKLCEPVMQMAQTSAGVMDEEEAQRH